MKAPYLPDIGEALYGRDWVTPLARAVGVSRRTMQYWRAGRGAPDEARSARMIALLRERQVRIARLLSWT